MDWISNFVSGEGGSEAAALTSNSEAGAATFANMGASQHAAAKPTGGFDLAALLSQDARVGDLGIGGDAGRFLSKSGLNQLPISSPQQGQFMPQQQDQSGEMWKYLFS